MNLLERATAALRGAREVLPPVPVASEQGHAWHLYHNPATGDTFKVWNATPEDMPDQMIVRGVMFDHAEPRAGMKPIEPPEFETGDVLYRYVTEDEAKEVAAAELKARVTEFRKSGKRSYNGTAMRKVILARVRRQRVFVQVQDA